MGNEAWPNILNANLHHNTREKYHTNTELLRHCFQVKAPPTMKENVQNIHLDFTCRHCRRKTSGDPASFHYVWLGSCTMMLFHSHYKMRIHRLGFAYGSCMILFCIFSCSSEVLCAHSSFFLYSHVDSSSVVLAAYFLFTFYQTG